MYYRIWKQVWTNIDNAVEIDGDLSATNDDGSYIRAATLDELRTKVTAHNQAQCDKWFAQSEGETPFYADANMHDVSTYGYRAVDKGVQYWFIEPIR